ncbi:MAG: hypothetical protein J6T10_23390 [Methanobrevibacter sp.]|nr:hypothetical protein [Methanobrevibacter sp.]
MHDIVMSIEVYENPDGTYEISYIQFDEFGVKTTCNVWKNVDVTEKDVAKIAKLLSSFDKKKEV